MHSNANLINQNIFTMVAFIDVSPVWKVMCSFRLESPDHIKLHRQHFMFPSTMMELVWTEIAALSKFQVAQNAFLRLFPSVYPIMDSQITLLWLVLTTLVAFISFFTVIWSLVLLQMISKNISKSTLFAYWGLLSTVFNLVLAEIFSFKWGKVTNVAFFAITV